MPSPVAVLVSGGLDSAILLAELCRDFAEAHPLYVQCGLRWEAAELAHLDQFLHAIDRASLRPLQVLAMPLHDLYGSHWSLTGRDVPAAGTPDEAVFLPGRNVLLLSKALIWCHLHAVPSVALATLHSNPFPDATDEFFDAYARVVGRAVAGPVRVDRPYARLSKTEVMHRGRSLPLEYTFSCIQPAGTTHCGRCNKCAERQAAFRDSGMADPTEYQTSAGAGR